MYHNPSNPDEFAEDGGEAYLRKSLLRNLKFGEVELPPTLEEQKQGIHTKPGKMSELGISYPVLLYVPRPVEQKMINPDLQPLPSDVVVDPSSGTGGGTGARGSGARPTTGAANSRLLSEYARERNVREPVLTVRRFDFVIQFAWEETPPSQRKLHAESAETSTAGGTNP
jgi:hypothetical protein